MDKSDSQFLVKRDGNGSSAWVFWVLQTDMASFLTQYYVSEFLKRTYHALSRDACKICHS